MYVYIPLKVVFNFVCDAILAEGLRDQMRQALKIMVVHRGNRSLRVTLIQELVYNFSALLTKSFCFLSKENCSNTISVD